MRSPLLAAVAAMGLALTQANAQGVQLQTSEAAHRVDVTIDGKPFTSYVWPDTLKKPVLYPLIAPDGIEVTRGYPLAPREGERTDHPHHAGMWFNYGNVDNFDFWNNSDAIKPADRGKMGTIHHQKIVSAKSGKSRGELVVDSVWTAGDGQNVMEQRTRYVFAKHGAGRSIDTIVTLRALRPLVFHDDKEGMLGIRVAHFLESANEKGGTFTDASGRPTQVQASNVPGATGVYLTSEGKQGDAVWSTRGRWCILTGTTGDHTETIAILDHPGNVNYPTYWHARGYGLFAANPLGQHIFDPKAEPLNYKLAQGQSVTFRYRVLLLSSKPSAETMNHEADAFAAEYH
ncbi:MAG: PmoA family protein [Acidobacteriota bacterium]|nr:PmoA family protein [Acidobacteriota bacterium]